MLAKKYRLPIQQFIGKNGKIVKTPFFLLKIFPARFPYSRFGVIISKKVSAKASERNRLKRIIFSALNPKLLPPKDFLIIAGPKMKDLEKEVIFKEISGILNY